MGDNMKTKKVFIGSIIIAGVIVILTAVFGYLLDEIILLEDRGASWYYWKLPKKELVPRFTAWFLYFSHQLFIWYGIIKLKKCKKDKSIWNKRLLIGNLVFILLHFIQTHLWYDGLAQDVPVMSSQGSVIGMLVIILIMENNRRGLFLNRKINGFNNIKKFILEYHGFYIAWAITYTFWFHPMVRTSGHLFGFFYIFLLFIQLSFAYTKIHTNKKWIFLLEVLVLFHGTAVAVGQQNNMWPMFAFGFGFLAVFTQIYSIKLRKHIYYIIQSLYILTALIVFGIGFAEKNISDIHQITWIPIIEYLLVFIIILIGEGLFKFIKYRK